MLLPGLKQVAYDPKRFIDVENVDEAMDIILCPTEGMTVDERWRNETPYLMRLIEPHVGRRSLVLDYGCGIGRMAKQLIEKLECHVIGVDISPNMRALAAACVDSPYFGAVSPEMFDKLFRQETAFPLRFDAAISIWVLQHCIDLDVAIDRIAKTLKPDGKLIIVNNVTRCVPVENGEWADDGLDVRLMIMNAGFDPIDSGKLDVSVAPGWMQEGTFWAVYQKG